MIQETFGNRIKELRSSKMISQLELSRLSGIDRAQISKIEKGKINVTLETIAKLSKAFGLQIITLMDLPNNHKMRPFVKWAGGKTQIIDKIKKMLPQKFVNYFEPFVGGGALFLDIAPPKAFINDANKELINAYLCLQNDELYYQLLEKLDEHESKHSEEHYYLIRSMDRLPNFFELPIYQRAARMIYLNKSCFNGLYRVNAQGYFNVPSAKKDKVKTYDSENMERIKDYFSQSDIHISCQDFELAVKQAQAGDFVYFDPPYDVLDNKESFTSYSKESFGKEEQARLARVYKELSLKGVKLMLSNHNTIFINELYKDFNINIVKAKRMINSNANGRGDVEEVIITNY